ncbi:MAG: NAD(P)-dependent oxidoreductase [Proteobacteria bacterium]|nr:NAD(P)-dependent oxidoreductase [Pseudomonadota bacterium]
MSGKGKGAFIGLGVMGFPMAGHLVAAGYEMTVYNRTQHTANRWIKEHTGRSATTPSEAAHEADFVFTCVGNDDDLRSVVLGEDGAFAGMKPGAVLIDNTTTSAIVARELYGIARGQGFHFLDAPVSGGQAGAENAALTVMVGGDLDVFENAKPAMEAYGKAVTLMGESGSGQLTKMVNQICIAGMVQALAEGLNFAQRAGLDGDLVLDVISKGAAQSWQMENRGKTMLRGEFDFGFAVDWMRKDLGICLEEANRNGARLQTTALVDQFYKHVQQKGGARFDTSSLMLPLVQD